MFTNMTHEDASQKIVRSILKSGYDKLQTEILLKIITFPFCSFQIFKGLFGRKIGKCNLPQQARHDSWLISEKKHDYLNPSLFLA